MLRESRGRLRLGEGCWDEGSLKLLLGREVLGDMLLLQAALRGGVLGGIEGEHLLTPYIYDGSICQPYTRARNPVAQLRKMQAGRKHF